MRPFIHILCPAYAIHGCREFCRPQQAWFCSAPLLSLHAASGTAHAACMAAAASGKVLQAAEGPADGLPVITLPEGTIGGPLGSH